MDNAEYKRMVTALLGDVKRSLRYHLEQDNQFWRRTYVRTIFAFIEAMAFHWKRVVLEAYDRGLIDFGPAEFAMLREESYDLNDKGEAFKQKRFIPLVKNLRFVCRSFARYKKASYELKVNDTGWSAFKNCVEIRNRLSHPKTASDLDISDADMKVAERTFAWFNRVTVDLLQSGKPN